MSVTDVMHHFYPTETADHYDLQGLQISHVSPLSMPDTTSDYAVELPIRVPGNNKAEMSASLMRVFRSNVAHTASQDMCRARAIR